MTVRWPWTYRSDPHDEAAIEDARRQLEKVLAEGHEIEALVRRLEKRRRANHFGEKIHAALRGTP